MVISTFSPLAPYSDGRSIVRMSERQTLAKSEIDTRRQHQQRKAHSDILEFLHIRLNMQKRGVSIGVSNYDYISIGADINVMSNIVHAYFKFHLAFDIATAAMATSRPTIVIVPGSFSAYGAYDPFVALLRAQGFTTFAVKLPSTQKRHPLPPATLQDDAAHVRGVVEALVAEKEGSQVAVLAHSYGGSVATEALAGLQSGVKRLVFLSATAPRVGETQISAMRLREEMLPQEIVSLLSFPKVQI